MTGLYAAISIVATTEGWSATILHENGQRVVLHADLGILLGQVHARLSELDALVDTPCDAILYRGR